MMILIVLVLAVVAVLGLNPTATAQDFFSVKPIDLLARCDEPEPIRTYADGYALAKSQQRPLLVLVTQKVCPPCKVAKTLLESMRAKRELADCVVVEIDSGDPVARSLMVGRRLSPQLILVNIWGPTRFAV